MKDYRLYYLVADGSHVARFEPIQGENDSEAVEIARLYAGISPLELWQEGRKVQVFPKTIAKERNPG